MDELSDDGTLAPCDKLVELAQAGNPEAFTTLFTYYSPGICGYVAGMVRCLEDRDELAQDIFFKAWKKLPSLQQASSFRPWLYRIATRVVYDYWRYQRSKPRFSLEEYLEGSEGPSDSSSLEEYVVEEELIRQALKQVPWKYRMCLLLEIEGKLSRNEIAEVVEIGLSSVTTYISKGREYFRLAYRHLQQYAKEEKGSTL